MGSAVVSSIGLLTFARDTWKDAKGDSVRSITYTAFLFAQQMKTSLVCVRPRFQRAFVGLYCLSQVAKSERGSAMHTCHVSEILFQKSSSWLGQAHNIYYCTFYVKADVATWCPRVFGSF